MKFPCYLWLLLACAVHAADIDIREHGAVSDGATLSTAAIQKSIDECSRRGGGVVTIPAGRFLTGTLFLRDGVRLRLDAGSVLLGSTDIADYQAVEPFTEGTGQMMGWCLIGAVDAKNIGIEGPGTIDGQGRALNAARPPSQKGKRPVVLRMVRCTGLTLSDLHLQASAMWMVHLSQSRDITINGLTIDNHVAGNNDGFDIDSCEDVRIARCRVDTQDDALCFKSTAPTPSRRIQVRDCSLKSACSSIKFGTESLGGFEDVTVRDCIVPGAGFAGISIFSVDGGAVRNLTLSGIAMEKVGTAICLRLGARLKTFRPGDKPKPPGTMERIAIKDVRVKHSQLGAIMLNGIPGHRIENVSLSNIEIATAGGGKAEDAKIVLPEKEAAYPENVMFGRTLPAYGLLARHVAGLHMQNCRITTLQPDARPVQFTEDVDNFSWTPASPAAPAAR